MTKEEEKELSESEAELTRSMDAFIEAGKQFHEATRKAVEVKERLTGSFD